MADRDTLGGVIHTYQRYDPQRFPSPTQPPPDIVSNAFEHLLAHGSSRRLTPEELARAVKIDPSQIAGLGPSIDALIAMLEERKRKILARYETESAHRQATKEYQSEATSFDVPSALQKEYQSAISQEQLAALERLWYRLGDDSSPAARGLLRVMQQLGMKYEIEELASRYTFTGREPLTPAQAIDVKEELARIDDLLNQLAEARETAEIGVIDLDALAEFAEPGDIEQLGDLQRQIRDYLEAVAEQQGILAREDGYELTPDAYRLFQGRLLERLFHDLAASRTGRHTGPVAGDGAVELQETKPYEFGDSIANIDIPGTFVNALVREKNSGKLRLHADDILVHKTRNTPKCATCVLMDMSGSMRYDGQYVNVKRMALAVDGLIRREYPGDWLQFFEIYSLAKHVPPGKVVELMPKPVTIYDPVVRLRADMSREDLSEYDLPPHFTNIQHGLSLARRMLAAQNTPNRQIVLITDGLPTAHFEGEMLYFLYPPDPRTEEATMREGHLCQQEGITINLFLLPSWSQSEEDIRFAYRLAESTRGRVFFTAGKDLDRYVVWDYVRQRREIIGS